MWVSQKCSVSRYCREVDSKEGGGALYGRAVFQDSDSYSLNLHEDTQDGFLC